MNIKQTIIFNFIKKRVPAPLKKILRLSINKRELFTFLFKYLPPLLIKFLFKLNIKSIKIDPRDRKNIKINIFFKKKRENETRRSSRVFKNNYLSKRKTYY